MDILEYQAKSLDMVYNSLNKPPIKHLLTKTQRAAGLDTKEEEHFLYLIDLKDNGQTIAVFSTSGATIEKIQDAAQEYLSKKETADVKHS